MEIKALAELLDSLFTADELRIFLHAGPQGERIVHVIAAGEPLQTIAYKTVLGLRAARCIDRGFFARLRAERPYRADEIAEVEVLWPEHAVTIRRATHVITLVAEVAGQAAAIDDELILDALGACDEDSRLAIDLHDCKAWAEGRDRIRADVQRHLREVVLRSSVRHVSLFGLAPIPWLMTLGYAVSETVEAQVFPRLRTPSTLRWQTDGVMEGWQTQRVSADPAARDVAVLVSASARVQVPRVEAVLSSRAIYELRLDRPGIDAVRSEAQLAAFGRCYRGLLDEIAEQQPQVERVHVFAAAPVAVAIDCGRRILHSGDPAVVAYTLVDGRYVRALELRA